MGIALRPPEPDDVAALLALFVACDEVDVGHPDSDEEDVSWRWRTFEFDRSRDAWVAEDGDGIAGYAWVFEGLAEVRVHPRVRSRGLGTRMLRTVEARAVEQGSRDGHVRQNVTSRNPDARRLLESAGYVPSHHYARMEVGLPARPQVPPAPAGVSLRSYEVGTNDAAVHDAFNRAWAQYEGERWEPESLERWLEQLESEAFDPTTWHLAVSDGRVIAFSLCEAYPGLGWIQYLGTVPEERGRGLGRLLLLHSLAVYYDRGIRRVGLTVSSSNVPAARHLYENVGMVEVLRYDNLKKPLDAIRSPSG